MPSPSEGLQKRRNHATNHEERGIGAEKPHQHPFFSTLLGYDFLLMQVLCDILTTPKILLNTFYQFRGASTLRWKVQYCTKG